MPLPENTRFHEENPEHVGAREGARAPPRGTLSSQVGLSSGLCKGPQNPHSMALTVASLDGCACCLPVLCQSPL